MKQMHPTMARLYEFLDKKNITKKSDIARRLGESPQTIKNLEMRGISRAGLIKAHKEFGADIQWLENGYWRPLTEKTDLKEGYIRYELLNVTATAGYGIENTDFPSAIYQIDVLESWAYRMLGTTYKRMQLITAEGTSMSPTIEDGNILFVEPTVEFQSDGVYVILKDGQTHVKRLQRLAGQKIAVISDNHLFQTEIFDATSFTDIRIIGRVMLSLQAKPIIKKINIPTDFFTTNTKKWLLFLNILLVLCLTPNLKGL